MTEVNVEGAGPRVWVGLTRKKAGSRDLASLHQHIAGFEPTTRLTTSVPYLGQCMMHLHHTPWRLRHQEKLLD
jgi:hypothetical protein